MMRVILGLYLSYLLLSVGTNPALATEGPQQTGHAKLANELHQFNQALTLDKVLYQPQQDVEDNDDADPQTTPPALFMVSSLMLSIFALSLAIYGFKRHHTKHLSR